MFKGRELLGSGVASETFGGIFLSPTLTLLRAATIRSKTLKVPHVDPWSYYLELGNPNYVFELSSYKDGREAVTTR